MKRFPVSVRDSMSASGAAVTCVPVQLDSASWETAVFFQLLGPESKEDRRVLREAKSPLRIGIETDLVTHEHAAVVLLRLEVYTSKDNPLVGEVLIPPGEDKAYFDTLSLLAQQQRLCWFFGDEAFWLIYSQQSRLEDEHRAEFDDLLRDATKHDALIRCTGRYDLRAALSDIVSRYELRSNVSPQPRQSANDSSTPFN